MTVGGSIVLMILGAILYFAVEVSIAGIEITTIGLILMVGGVIGLIVGLILRTAGARRAPVRRERVVEEPRGRVVEERDPEL